MPFDFSHTALSRKFGEFASNKTNYRANQCNQFFLLLYRGFHSIRAAFIGQTVDLHFRENNVEVSDSYACNNIEDCYAVVLAIKSYAQSNGIEIVRSNTDLVGELRLHNFLYRIGYKQNETGDADLEYLCDRRWYVNVASRVIGWTGL